MRPPVDAILQKVLEAVPFQLTVDGGIDEARRRLRDLPRAPVHPELRVENHQIDGPAGPIPIRVYWPSDIENPPVTMYFHGGGFAVGDLDTHDGTARNHAVSAGTVVVSVDYRLAPEHPYPAAVDDVWAATRWVAANAGSFGADGSRLAVAGDSAGGTLSAVVAQLARDNDGPPIAFQLLWYPSAMWDNSRPRSPRTLTRRYSTTPPSTPSAGGTPVRPICLTRRRAWLPAAPRTCPACRRPISRSPATTHCATTAPATPNFWLPPV
jgi:acetyl esterase/lipase